MRWKLAAGAGVLIVVAWFAWLHEHDKRIRMLEHTKELEATAQKKDQQIAGFIQSLELMNKEYHQLRTKYLISRKVNADSIAALGKQIDWWSSQIRAMLPEGSKHLVDDVQAACKEQITLEQKNTTECERNLTKADSIIQKQDTIIWGLTDSRDNYKNLYDMTKGYSASGGAWATVGKIETGVGIIGLITKFFGLW